MDDYSSLINRVNDIIINRNCKINIIKMNTIFMSFILQNKVVPKKFVV